MNKRLIKSNDEGGGVAASFNTVLYTGNGGTKSITDVGFEPDFVWIKSRNAVGSHIITDSVRGNGKEIYTDLTNAEGTVNRISLTDTGFDVNSVSYPNKIGDTYVAWCLKAGGSAVTNTDGTITSQVSANTEAGFSVVSYTGNGATSATIGHALSDAPKMYIIKSRGAGDWWVYNENLNGGVNPASYFLRLNLTNAESLNTGSPPSIFAGTEPTASVFSIGASLNVSSTNYIAYCFAEVAGFSKFGSYSGSNSPITIYTTDDGTAGGSNPFEPAFIMTKRTNSPGGSWIIQDNKRRTTDGDALFPNLSAVESFGWNTSFNSNGFTISSNEAWISESGGEYIYMAFANQF